MLKKRILAVMFAVILTIGSLPVMPLLQDSVDVRAAEVSDDTAQIRAPKKKAPEPLVIYTDKDEKGDEDDLILSSEKEKYEDHDPRSGRINGKISLPYENNIPAVNPSISLKEAKDILVREKYTLKQGHIGSEEKDVPAAYPYSSDEKDLLNLYFDTRLPYVRDQGATGTCWAHSALGAIESYLMSHPDSRDIHGDIKRDTVGYKNLLPGINYSELHLAYFTYHNTENPLIGGQEKDKTTANLKDSSFFDFGGDEFFAAKTLFNWRGAVDETLFPLSDYVKFDTSDKKSAVTGIPDDYAENSDSIHLSNAYYINIEENVNQVKQAIIENGAVCVGYDDEDGCYNEEYNTYYNVDGGSPNHAVNIVGWDDNFPLEFFKNDLIDEYVHDYEEDREDLLPQNNGAWLIRNSWWDTLADPDDDKLSYLSYFWISYEDPSLSDVLVLEAEQADNYNNNYFYTNSLSSEGTETDFDTVANVFTLNGASGSEKESIDAVALLTRDANVKYNISVYAVDSEGKPDLSKKLNITDTEGTIVFPGIYTIPLASPVILKRGERFAVVVNTADGNIASELALKYGVSNNNFTTQCYANAGESFAYLDDEGWIDYSEYYEDNDGYIGNFYIQVFTSDVSETAYHSVEGLRCTGRTGDSISIAWDPLGGNVKYDVFRALNSFELNDFYLVGSDLTDTAFTDSGLPGSSRCYYVVVPVIEYTDRDDLRSYFISVETKPKDGQTGSGTIITDPRFKTMSGRKSLVYGPLGSAYRNMVQYKEYGSDEWQDIETRLIDLRSYGLCWAVYEDQLPPGRYSFRKISFFSNIYGEKYTGTISETGDGEVINFYPAPSEPSYTYDEEADSITLSWEPVDEEGVTGYDIFKIETVNNETGFTKINTSVVTGTSITFTHSELPAEQVIDYSIYVNVDRFSDLDNYMYSYGATVEASRMKPLPSLDAFEIVYPTDKAGEYMFYDGYPHQVKVNTNIPEEEIGKITVYYKNLSSSIWTSEVPVKAGYYFIALDIEGGTKYRSASKLSKDTWFYYIGHRIVYIVPGKYDKFQYEDDPEFSYEYTVKMDEENEKLDKVKKELEHIGFTGSLGRVEGEEVGTYKYGIGTLDFSDDQGFDGSNYVIRLDLSTNKFFTIKELPKMTAPEIQVLSKTRTSVELSWTADAHAFRYAVYDEDENRICVTNKTGCVIKGLKPETEYTFKVYPFRNITKINDEGEPGSITLTTEGRDTLTSSDFVFEAPLNVVFTGESCEEPVFTPNVDVVVTGIYYKKQGTDTWENTAVNAGKYTVAIDTEETDMYSAAKQLSDENWSFEILPSDKKIPGSPSEVKIVAFGTNKVGMIELPDDWAWDTADAEKELTVGKPLSVKAIYQGTDKENYLNTETTITLIRSICEHEHTETINIKASTCSEKGYTGDLYCSDCEQILEKGNETDLKAHTYGKASYIWNSDRTKCIAEAACTAEGCDHKVTEEAVITSEVLTVVLAGEETQITRFTATFTNTDAFENQVFDVEGAIENTENGEESGEGSGSGEGTGESSGSGEGSGEGSGSGEGAGEGSGSGEGAGEGSGNGEGTGEGSGSGEGTGEGSGSGEGTGEGSGSGQGTGEGSSDNGSGNSGNESGSGSGNSDSGSSGSSSGSSDSGSGSSGGSGYTPVVVNPSDNTSGGSTDGTTNNNTSGTVNTDDKSGKDDKTNTGDKTDDGTGKDNTTGNGDTTGTGDISSKTKTITKTTKDKDGNTEKNVYTVKKDSKGTKKADQGVVVLKTKTCQSVNETISGVIKNSGKKYIVEAIAKKAMYKNKSVTTLVIGSNIKRIGTRAFAYNSNLETIWILSTKLESIGKDAFKKIAANANIYIVTKDADTFNRIKELIEKSGIGKKVNIEQRSKKAYNTWKASLSNS